MAGNFFGSRDEDRMLKLFSPDWTEIEVVCAKCDYRSVRPDGAFIYTLIVWEAAALYRLRKITPGWIIRDRKSGDSKILRINRKWIRYLKMQVTAQGIPARNTADDRT